MRVLVIDNPRSGAGSDAELYEFVRALVSSGAEVDVRPFTGEAPIAGAARRRLRVRPRREPAAATARARPSPMRCGARVCRYSPTRPGRRTCCRPTSRCRGIRWRWRDSPSTASPARPISGSCTSAMVESRWGSSTWRARGSTRTSWRARRRTRPPSASAPTSCRSWATSCRPSPTSASCSTASCWRPTASR